MHQKQRKRERMCAPWSIWITMPEENHSKKRVRASPPRSPHAPCPRYNSSKKRAMGWIDHISAMSFNAFSQRLLRSRRSSARNRGHASLLERGNKYYNKHFERKRITEPLNDHELAKSLAIAGGQPRDGIDTKVQWEFEDKLRVHATADVNKRIRGLFGGLLRSLVSTENVN